MKKIAFTIALVLSLGLSNAWAEGNGNSTNETNIDLLVSFDNQDVDTKDFSHIIYIGETAVLPITARSSEAARLLEGKHLNAKKLKQLFFLNDDFDEDVKKNKTFEAITVYSGSNATSVASFLNTAIAKDPLGVTFNTLSNIFDLQSRHLKSDLSLVGLDLKKDLEKSFTDNGTLDDVLTILENGKPAEAQTKKVVNTLTAQK